MENPPMEVEKKAVLLPGKMAVTILLLWAAARFWILLSRWRLWPQIQEDSGIMYTAEKEKAGVDHR
ncbi:MAG: hypothetical protein LKE64_09725 [Solobacterium sp.]|jgi:hypothetical protein|nr:hypothetical protein [Solobacterium sp.]MCH4048497.1 hypothetical protein [Solobacterium sp.]MCH4074653.1 hypothetical protein [Solobacterium sp.]